MPISITGGKYAEATVSVVEPNSVQVGTTPFVSTDFTVTRLVGLWSSAGIFKGMAWVRTFISTSRLELETPFFDPATGLAVTQVVGDRVLVSKNFGDSVQTGLAATARTATITDVLTFGVAGNQLGVCFYDEAKYVTSTSQINLSGGLTVWGKLDDYAKNLVSSPIMFYSSVLNMLMCSDAAVNFCGYGGRWETSASIGYLIGSNSFPTATAGQTVVLNGIETPNDLVTSTSGGNWVRNPERHQVVNCYSVSTGTNAILRRWGNGVIRGGRYKFPRGTNLPLSVFGSDATGTYTVAADPGDRAVILDMGTDNMLLRSSGAGTSITFNFTNLITTDFRFLGATAANPNGRGNYFFSDTYTNLKTATVGVILNDLGTVAASVASSTASWSPSILRRTSVGFTDTVVSNSWTYGFKKYGFQPVSGTITPSTYDLGTAGVADNVVLGGAINQLADLNVTRTQAAAAALTSVDTVDDLYDVAVNWGTLSVTNVQYPSLSAYPVLASGTVADFGAKTLVIDSGAASAFAVVTGTNTITAKASTLAAGTKFATVAATAIQVAASTTVSAALSGSVSNAGTITGSVTGDLIYLSQGAGANLFRYSEQQENAAWLKTRCSITANAAIGPNGKMTAEKLVEDTSNNSHYSYQQVSVTSGVTYTMSCYAKASERSILVMQFHGSNSAFSLSWVFFNLLTGTTSIGSGSPTVQMQYVGDGWYRCAITSVATATAFANIQPFGIATSTSSSSYQGSYQGDGASGIFITGAQLEASSAVGPYIPTQANAVTLSGQGSLVGTATGDVIYSNGLANTQTLVATTSIMNLPKSGAISTAGSINFGTSTRILPTGNLTASNTAFAGTLTIETATAIDLTLTNCSGQVNLTVTGNGSVRVILGGSTPRTILPTTLPSGVTVAVACSVVDSTGASFNIVARYGTTGAYTDLGYQTNVTSASYLVAYGSPVELCMWRLGYLSFVRTITTTSGGFSLSAEMIAEPDVNTALNVASYLSNITVSSTGGTFTATFEADANIVGIELTKAIVHRLLGLEAAMRALLPPGTASVLEIEADEIQINQPAVFLRLGTGATDVAISGYINTAPALAIDPTYRINPRRVGDNLRVEIPLVKPAIDTGQIALAVRAELAPELAKMDATISSRMPDGIVDANIIKVNDIFIDGTGTESDPWGPV